MLLEYIWIHRIYRIHRIHRIYTFGLIDWNQSIPQKYSGIFAESSSPNFTEAIPLKWRHFHTNQLILSAGALTHISSSNTLSAHFNTYLQKPHKPPTTSQTIHATHDSVMQYRHTRESAQNKPHSSFPPWQTHISSNCLLAHRAATLRSSCTHRRSTGALIINESLYRLYKSRLSQRRATPYIYRSKSAPNSEIPESHHHAIQNPVLEHQTFQSKTSAIQMSHTSIKCN